MTIIKGHENPPGFKITNPCRQGNIDAMGVQRIELPGCEADDLLGTLAKYYQKKALPFGFLAATETVSN